MAPMNRPLSREIFTSLTPLSDDDRRELWRRKRQARRELINDILAPQNAPASDRRPESPLPHAGFALRARSLCRKLWGGA